jgi:hypothetical protein
MKFYHASPYRLNVGTLLEPNLKKQNYEYSEEYVYMSTSPVPHITVIEKAVLEGWHVYEVRPVGRLSMGHWNDARSPKAKVIRYVGSARGIAKAKKQKNGYKTLKGSIVEARKMPRKTKNRGCYTAAIRDQITTTPNVKSVREMAVSSCVTSSERHRLYTKLGLKVPSWLENV